MNRLIRIVSWFLFGLLFVEMLWDSAHYYAKEPNQLVSVGLVTLFGSCAVAAYFLLSPLWQQRVRLVVFGLVVSVSSVFCVQILRFVVHFWALPAPNLSMRLQLIMLLLAVFFVLGLIGFVYAKKFFEALKSISPEPVA